MPRVLLSPHNLKDLDSSKILLTIHGGSLKGHDQLSSSPEKQSFRRGTASTIEIDIADVDEISADELPNIVSVTISAVGKKVRKLPEILWNLPSLGALTVHGEHLVQSLFERTVPNTVEYLGIVAHGQKDITPLPPATGVKYLHIDGNEFFLKFDQNVLPNLVGAELPTFLSSKNNFRNVMMAQISTLSKLKELGLNPASNNLDYSKLPVSIQRLALTRGDLQDCRQLEHLQDVRFLQLHSLKRLTSFDGLSKLARLKEIRLVNCTGIQTYDTLFEMPSLERVDFLASQAPEVADQLIASGIVVGRHLD